MTDDEFQSRLDAEAVRKLRDSFAAYAMQGIMTRDGVVSGKAARPCRQNPPT